MKKRFPAFFLTLALCMGLCTVPAFAADTTPVTAAGISFKAMVTDRYESTKSLAEDNGWADSYGPEAEFEYFIGRQAVREEGVDGFGLADFCAYLVEDDVTLDFHLKKGEKFYIEGYYLSVIESSNSGEVYEPIYIYGATFTAPEDGDLIGKDVIDYYFRGADYLLCYRGSEADFDWDEAVNIVFADKDAVPNTVPSFSDVTANAYYAAPVTWAIKKEITNGVGNNKFAPGTDCSHMQILTMLWRAAGETVSTSEAPVSVASYYQEAANWAYEKEMIDGNFDPNKPCTRADAVNYIWQAFDKPSAEDSTFTDVPASAAYAKAVDWAVGKGVTTGVGNNKFNPDKVCSRSEIVTFLFRAYKG